MIPVEYQRYSKNCGNWAAYDRDKELCYCGWMDMHNDLNRQGATKAEPWFTIDVKYATSKGRLVHVKKGKLTATRLRKGMIAKFDASKNHAFIPVKVAKSVVKNQKWGKESKDWDEGSTPDTQVRVVWTFV